MIEYLIRKFVLPRAFKDHPRFVVASSGRSGSTMLFRAVASSFLHFRFGGKFNSWFLRRCRSAGSDFVDRIEDLCDRDVYFAKTHDTYHKISGNVKIIFIYGDPLESALSVMKLVETKGHDWFLKHIEHLHGSGQFSEILQKDVLNYEGQIESWLGANDPDLFCVSFDHLWNKMDELSEFLGFTLVLPPKRNRVPKDRPDMVNTELFDYLKTIDLKYSR